ncbi:MAG: L,D-transpeptidase [Candidatus Margulisbacteria bacterium]|nr:L,D-transpeptidase [Candidatus Margulisiibacteriota bacterium]
MIQAIFDLYQQEHAAKKENKNEIKIYVSEKKMKVNINGFKKEYSVSTGALKGQKLFANDLRTPLGRYKVIKIQDSTKWKFKTTSGAYGPWFIRLKTAWSGIGIHGIHDENLIGDANSHGCIRLRNQDIHELVAHVYKGLEVVIFP